MSFDFNLSSDEDDNNSTISFTAKDEDESNTFPFTANNSNICNNINDNDKDSNNIMDDDDDDDLAIEWEDGEETSFMEFQEEECTTNNNNTNVQEEENKSNDNNQQQHQQLNNGNSNRKEVLKDITIEIDINEETNEIQAEESKIKSNKKKRTLSKIKLENLPNTISSLVVSLHHCHLLSLISHSMYISNVICGNENNDTALLHNMALSILPISFLDVFSSNSSNSGSSIPIEENVKELCGWFSQYINNIYTRRMNVWKRNRQLGAPGRPRRSQRRGRAAAQSSSSSSSNKKQKISNTKSKNYTSTTENNTLQDRLLQLIQALSPIYEENPNEENLDIISTIQPIEKTQLLLCIMDSLGCMVRYVSSLFPISRDFTINHPLLYSSSTLNHEVGEDEDLIPTHPLVWLEILCQSNNNNQHSSTSSSSSKTTSRSLNKDKNIHRTTNKKIWLHVDIHHEIFNQPRSVELLQTNIIQASSSDNSSSNNIRKKNKNKIKITNKSKVIPVSYVIAIESQHRQQNVAANSNNVNPCMITDVTPRYANAWSQSLAIRGMTKMQILASQGYCIDEWWADTLQKLNATFSSGGRKKRQRKKVKEVIVIDSDIEDDNPCVPSNKNDHSKIRNHESNSLQDEEQILHEEQELQSSIFNEAIPTSKTAFKNHPCYAMPSALNKDQVLHPNAKQRICGLFKGEVIYRRSDVSTAYSYKKWLYLHRKVTENELSNPVLVKKPPTKKNSSKFKALTNYGVGDGNDGTEDTRQRIVHEASQGLEEDNDLKLYGLWQTQPWSPPYIGPNDPLPVNSYNNIEKELLNPGLVHMQQLRLSILAKKLGIPYAPCLLGFEGHHGNRTPTIKGIIVHEHNQMLLEEAYIEYQGCLIEKEIEKKQKSIYSRWKRLIFGALTKERLDREYGDENYDDVENV